MKRIEVDRNPADMIAFLQHLIEFLEHNEIDVASASQLTRWLEQLSHRKKSCWEEET